MTISSGVFQTFANLLPWWALLLFNAHKGGEKYKKTVTELLELQYQRFNVIAEDAAARIRQTPTHFKNGYVRTFREVAVDILYKPILTFLNSNNAADGYVLVHDAPGEAPITKRHTAKERANRTYGDRPPTQTELNAREFDLKEPMPWTMQQIFGTLAGRRKFLRALYLVLASEDFRAHMPPGKFVVFDGAIKEDGSWGVARITKGGSEWLDDVPLVREGDNAVMRWVHKLATSAEPPGPHYLVTSNDGDVLLALLASHFRLDSEALRDITLTFHTKRMGKEFMKLLDDDREELAPGPDGREPGEIEIALANLKESQRKEAVNFEQLVEGEKTDGRVDFFFDIRAVARLIREVHPDDPYAVESFLVAFLVACDKHDFVWHRFFCTNVGVENVLPAHVVWAPLYGPLVTHRRVEGPLDCGRTYYEFDMRALFAFVRTIYYAKFYQAKQKGISKKNFARTQSNSFLECVGRADLKDDLIAQPIDYKAEHGGAGMYDLDEQLMEKATQAHIEAYKETNRKKSKPTATAFKKMFGTDPMEDYGPVDVFWKRLIMIGITQVAYMLHYMSSSPFGQDVVGTEVDPATGRPYAAYTEDDYTDKPLVYYQDTLSDEMLRGKGTLLFRYPFSPENVEPVEPIACSSSSSSSKKARGGKRRAESSKDEWAGLDEWAEVGCKRQRLSNGKAGKPTAQLAEKDDEGDGLDGLEEFLEEIGPGEARREQKQTQTPDNDSGFDTDELLGEIDELLKNDDE